MSNIRISVQNVLNAGGKASKSAQYISSIRGNLNSIRNGIDPQILARNNIAGQFNAINSQLESAESLIKRIKSVTEQNAMEYEKTDMNIAKKIKLMSIPKK